MIVVNNTKKRKLQYISLADSDKLSASIGQVTFADSGNGWNRGRSVPPGDRGPRRGSRVGVVDAGG
jgi:hypothetical protein